MMTAIDGRWWAGARARASEPSVGTGNWGLGMGREGGGKGRTVGDERVCPPRHTTPTTHCSPVHYPPTASFDFQLFFISGEGR